MLMVFSENYRFQNEEEKAYLDQQQVALHPFMTYFMKDSEHKTGLPKSLSNILLLK